MINFEFYNPAKIVFGKGVIKEVGKQIKEYHGKKVLLVYGGGSIKRNGIYEQVKDSLQSNGIYFEELSGIQPNPRLRKIYDGKEICLRDKIDFILAVGGGSTIDTAKGIGVAVANPAEDVWNYYMTGKKIPFCLPIGVVLTIPAAGSETSFASVITNEDGNYKRGIHDDIVIPKFAIMDPETSYSLSTFQMACGAADILAHLMERYFTKVENVELTDRMIEAAAITIINNAVKAVKHPKDYNVRAEIMLTGTFAHNNSLNCGRVGDWGSHNIEHELSGTYDIAHGEGLAIIFPAWIKYVWRSNPEKFVRFANEVFGVKSSKDDDEFTVQELLVRLEAWYKELLLPTRLSEIGIDGSNFESMAKRALVGREEGIGEFVKLKEKDIIEIFKLAL